MISKSQQNMAILDDDLKFTQNMNEMPKNLSLDKINCDKSPTLPAEDNKNHLENFNDINKNVKVNENIDIKSTDLPNETRLQLSFSVDRLLSDKVIEENKNSPSPVHCHDQPNDKCCDDMSNSYSCCTLPNCLINSTTSKTSTNLGFPGNTYQSNDEDMSAVGSVGSFMDFKSIVRPTPVRAMGNSTESVPSLTHFSSLPPTALIRFHHAQMQQQQKQLTTHLPAQPNFNLSSLMNPLCGLKPHSLNSPPMSIQNFSTALTNRFNAKVNFDIPIVRPNLNCINPLRHHPLQIPSTNETHMNFNSNTTTSSSTTNSSATNTNSGNSHGNISSGKRKRSWSRAVFSNLQRKGLEIQFQQQKYITKPDRRKLAARLNLTDAQVKVWFQNRRMKWRHTRENLKSGQEKQPGAATTDSLKTNVDNVGANDLPGYSSDGSSSLEMSDMEEDDDEIDVVE